MTILKYPLTPSIRFDKDRSVLSVDSTDIYDYFFVFIDDSLFYWGKHDEFLGTGNKQFSWIGGKIIELFLRQKPEVLE